MICDDQIFFGIAGGVIPLFSPRPTLPPGGVGDWFFKSDWVDFGRTPLPPGGEGRTRAGAEGAGKIFLKVKSLKNL